MSSAQARAGPEPEAIAEAEPVVEAEHVVGAEAESGPERSLAAEAEPEPEPVVADEAEVDVEAEPEAELAAAAETPVPAEAEPVAEVEPEPEPEPVAAAVPEVLEEADTSIEPEPEPPAAPIARRGGPSKPLTSSLAASAATEPAVSGEATSSEPEPAPTGDEAAEAATAEEPDVAPAPIPPAPPMARRGGPSKKVSSTLGLGAAAAAATPGPTVSPGATPGAAPGPTQASTPTPWTPAPATPGQATPGQATPTIPATPSNSPVGAPPPPPPPVRPAGPGPVTPGVAPAALGTAATTPSTPAGQQPAARRPDAVVGAAAVAATRQAADAQPAARLPTDQVAPRPKAVATVDRRIAQPGDRICGNCGEANDATRKFCRRCGNSLVAAQVVTAKPLPWYRRIFQRQPKQPKPMQAGDRVGSMTAGAKSGWRGLMKGRTFVAGILAIVIGLGVIGYVGVPGVSKYVSEFTSGGLPGIVNRVGNFFNPPQVLVRPVKDRLRASSEVADHPIANLFDSRSNTDWRADGGTPSATVTFPEKVDLLSLYVYSGIAGDDFVNLRRPATLQFTFPDGSSQTVTLQDVHDKQFFELKANGVDTVTITVPSTTGPDDAPVAISEIEFFKKGDGSTPPASNPGG